MALVRALLVDLALDTQADEKRGANDLIPDEQGSLRISGVVLHGERPV